MASSILSSCLNSGNQSTHPKSPLTRDQINHWTGKLLVFLAFGSFVLSYAGMYTVAVDAGYGWLSFLWPLVTETAVVIFSLVYLVAKLNNYNNRWLMPLILGCTGLSVLFNVGHVPQEDIFARAVVALPPLFLFAAFKTWIWKIEQDTRRHQVLATTAQLQAECNQLETDLQQHKQNYADELAKMEAAIEHKQTQLEQLNAEVQRAKTSKNDDFAVKMQGAKVQNRQARIEQTYQLLQRGVQDLKQIAEQIGISDARTIRSYLTELQEQGRIHVNGQGIEVV